MDEHGYPADDCPEEVENNQARRYILLNSYRDNSYRYNNSKSERNLKCIDDPRGYHQAPYSRRVPLFHVGKGPRERQRCGYYISNNGKGKDTSYLVIGRVWIVTNLYQDSYRNNARNCAEQLEDDATNVEAVYFERRFRQIRHGS
mmetsp:Transcript_24737/g.44436  ORF Transcript_24737/g.44436 Transcript_24737/m.44436 type:complete len:145 (-) Transcript_24737:84-518(-)